MTNNFQINTVYSNLLSKVHNQSESLFTNQKSKKSVKHFVTICYISSQKKKLLNLRKKQKQHQHHGTLPLYDKQTVCNMLSYVLLDEEQLTLSFWFRSKCSSKMR